MNYELDMNLLSSLLPHIVYTSQLYTTGDQYHDIFTYYQIEKDSHFVLQYKNILTGHNMLFIE